MFLWILTDTQYNSNMIRKEGRKEGRKEQRDEKVDYGGATAPKN